MRFVEGVLNCPMIAPRELEINVLDLFNGGAL